MVLNISTHIAKMGVDEECGCDCVGVQYVLRQIDMID